MVFFLDGQTMVQMDIFEEYKDVFEGYVERCLQQSEVSAYVCAYGQAGLAFAAGDQEQWVQYLLTVAQSYQQPWVFKALGDFYQYDGQLTKAKHYYVQSLLLVPQEDAYDIKQQILRISGG